MDHNTARDLVSRAARMAEPTIMDLIDKHNWGPRYLAVEVNTPELDAPMLFIYGMQEAWDPAWGRGDEPLDFVVVAGQKRETAVFHQMPSGDVPDSMLADGQRNWAGGVVRPWCSVGASGIKGYADELAASHFADCIRFLQRIDAEAAAAA